VTIQENVPLAPYTTLGVGGPARWYARIDRQHQLLSALSFAHARRLPIFILGGGSNLLVADAGFPGLVIHAAFGDISRVDPDRYHLDPTTHHICVHAGISWDDFVLGICRQGISGVECLAGIPGLVGGSPIQNIGAYGQEAADTIAGLTALDLETLTEVTLDREACRFAYRSSIFNTTHRNRYIITAVDFQFDPDARPNLSYTDVARHFAGSKTPPTPVEVYAAIREIRSRKGMLLVEGDPDTQSAGSFFKNPVVEQSAVEQIAAKLEIPLSEIPQWPAGEEAVKLSAAWLIERAGFHRGFHLGRAGISSKHTLALVNLGNATAAEIVTLRDAIVDAVQLRFAISLEQEPVMLGF
jgi:UDP-N-acetylmuramate dehydrogenase